MLKAFSKHNSSCLCMCVRECMYVRMSSCVCICWTEINDRCLYHSTLNFLGQNLSLNLELIDSSRLQGWWALGTACPTSYLDMTMLRCSTTSRFYVVSGPPDTPSCLQRHGLCPLSNLSNHATLFW